MSQVTLPFDDAFLNNQLKQDLTEQKNLTAFNILMDFDQEAADEIGKVQG